jgi:DNA-cytosine methyltransferase
MAEGFRRAGLPISMAFDWDDDACASYDANFGHRPIQVDVRDLLRLLEAGASLGHVDLLVADPPCTPWSRAGKRQGLDDERDMLRATVDLVRAIRPSAFLIANVPGLADEPNWPVVQRTIGSLESRYAIDFARLDAASYGVPQHRVRPFWYGRDRNTPPIVWSARTHGSPSECSRTNLRLDEPLRPWITCREALGHLAPEERGSPVRLRWRGQNGMKIASTPDEPARVVGTSSLSDGNVLAEPSVATRKHKASRSPRASHFDEPAHVVTTRDSAGDGNILFDGPNHRPSRADAPARTLTQNTHGDGALMVVPEPSRTVRASSGATPDKLIRFGHPSSRADEPSLTGHHGKSFLSDNRGHGPNAIKLSEKAAAILQSFPAAWVFAGKTKRARWQQIGMAMPPLLAEAVARAIARQLAKSSEAA